MATEVRILKYIKFSMIPGLGPVTRNRLLELCGSIDACYEMGAEEIMQSHRYADKRLRIGEKRLQCFIGGRDSRSIEEQARMVMAGCAENHVDVITAEDQRYPERFRYLPDMPVILYMKGNLKINDYNRSAGIVGARRCSAEGKRMAIIISKQETAAGSAIISGLAKGIDSYAHTAAVKNKGYTIAVLGNGPDICYPAEHKKLYDEIVLCGCVLSEYPPGTRAKDYMFPKRNRLIAALSDELIVIDAGKHSGTESTVEYCRVYGRKVSQIHLPATCQR